MKIQIANSSHAKQISAIYAPFVTDGLVTFETQIPGIEEFENRIVQYSRKYPWLVMVEGTTVLGYAYASAYRERVAYQWVAECSVYIHPDQKKKGIAGRLYTALFKLLQLQGIYKVYAVITVPNPESVGFHEKMGFRWFATYENVGYKSGHWCHVGWWQLTLKEADENIPAPPFFFPDLDPGMVEKILQGSM
ncbi:MAG: GNAT family N-acetyltransferase [Niabella sp.]